MMHKRIPKMSWWSHEARIPTSSSLEEPPRQFYRARNVKEKIALHLAMRRVLCVQVRSVFSSSSSMFHWVQRGPGFPFSLKSLPAIHGPEFFLWLAATYNAIWQVLSSCQPHRVKVKFRKQNAFLLCPEESKKQSPIHVPELYVQATNNHPPIGLYFWENRTSRFQVKRNQL